LFKLFQVILVGILLVSNTSPIGPVDHSSTPHSSAISAQLSVIELTTEQDPTNRKCSIGDPCGGQSSCTLLAEGSECDERNFYAEESLYCDSKSR
jgi:hypothetical protein